MNPDRPLARRTQQVLVVAALLLVGWGWVCSVGTASDPHVIDDRNDLDLFEAVVDRVQVGEGYYSAFGAELSGRGYPTASIFNWRLPTLTVVEAALPTLGWSVALVWVFGLATMVLWIFVGVRLAPRFWWLWGPALILTLPLWPLFSGPSVLLHDLWTGQLLALSLALRAHGRSRASAVVALLAMTVRALTGLFILTMAIAAFVEGDRRDVKLWVATGVAGLLIIAWHAAQVLPLMPAEGFTNPWLLAGGWCFVLKTARVNVLLLLAPTLVLAHVVPAMLAGLWLAPAAVGRRVAWVVTAYLVAFMLVGATYNWYWGLLVSPLLPLGVFGWFGLHAQRSEYRILNRADG